MSSRSLRPARAPALVSLSAFFVWLTLLAWILVRLHYRLPEARIEDFDSQGKPAFNEKRALDIIREWGNTYRIVGTPHLVEAEQNILSRIQDIKSHHEASSLRKIHEIEVWHQRGSSSHLFDFMGKPTWKKYYNLTNVVVRISDGTSASKNNAILVNAHLDSTLPSPGAADDGVGVAVMLEALRVVAGTPTRLANAIVLLFNGAEESLQDASHLFITQHEIKDTIRAVINLEACGTTGAEILFQATSEAMIRAYATVPYPYGAVLATELFSTGLIISDTDFRQFEQYGALTGLDMALVGNSYFYHTRRDTPDAIEPGTLQHMGENTLALLRYLTSPSISLIGIQKSHSTVYFSLLGGLMFIVVRARSATIAYTGILLLTIGFLLLRGRPDRKRAYAIATIGIVLSIASGSLFASITAFFVSHVRQRSLAWYRREYYAVILFGPPALLGLLLAQYGISVYSRRSGVLKRGEGLLQHTTICAVALYHAPVALGLQLCNMLSSYLWAIGAVTALLTLIINDFVLVRDWTEARPVSFLALLMGQILPMVWATEGMASIIDLLVPLSGRLGADAPADYIIAIAVAVIVVGALPMAHPLAHRIGERALLRLIAFLSIISICFAVAFTRPGWQTFDADHPKRLFSLHMENITEPYPSHKMLFASADGEAHFLDLISATLTRIGIESGALSLSQVSDSVPDYDIIFPLGQLLNSVSIPLETHIKHSPWSDTFVVRAEGESLNAVTRRRKLTLVIDHPGIIWTVVAFDADIVSWDLPEMPASGNRRHHVKEVSGYGVDRWTLGLEVQLDALQFESALRRSQRLKGQRPPADADDCMGAMVVDYSGLDRQGMWPVNADSYVPGSQPGMDFFRKFDAALPDWVDGMLLSAVSGRKCV